MIHKLQDALMCNLLFSLEVSCELFVDVDESVVLTQTQTYSEFVSKQLSNQNNK